jgi:ankyrin repeat protein
VNAKDKYGDTPLHLAIEKGHPEFTKLLISHGADVNAKDGDGCTPLHLAVEKGHSEVAKLLRQYGARE